MPAMVDAIEDAINDALHLYASPIGIGDLEITDIALKYAEQVATRGPSE